MLLAPQDEPQVRAALGFMLTALLSALTSNQEDPTGPALGEAIALGKSFVYHGIAPVLLRCSNRPDLIPLLLDPETNDIPSLSVTSGGTSTLTDNPRASRSLM